MMQTKSKFHITWNGELKKLAFFFAGIFVTALILVNLWIAAYTGSLRRENNIFIATVMGNVAVLYPEVDEVQMIRLLNDTANLDAGEELLAQYGVFMGDDGGIDFSGWKDAGKSFAGKSFAGKSFDRIEGQFALLRVCLNFFTVFLFVCFGLFLCVYFGIRQRKVENMAEYMEALSRGSYSLEIADNRDDELSALRNEVYKLTVFLKEQAGRALAQKKALADSVADISHQLKTPLTSLTVLVDNLTENDDMDEGTRLKFTREISRQLSGMSWLIAAMLKLSRLEAGVVELERARCAAGDLAESAVQKLETMCELADVTVTRELPEGVFLWIDRDWTVEALVNILKNAIEHSPAGGKIEIRGVDNDVYTELRITDHGTGITKEERDRLFRRFYRGETAKEDSVGIGLALAKEIVEKQNGHISVDSEEEKGTVFSIRFLK